MKRPSPPFPTLPTNFKRIYHSLYFAPVIIFLSMTIITYGAWRNSQATLKNDINNALLEHTSHSQDILTRRLNTYEQIMIGGSGLFRGSQQVTAAEWHDYVSTFDVDRQYPGVQAIGYIKIFGAADLPSVVANMQEQGITDFHVVPDTPRGLYTAILYSDPPQMVSPIGIDLFTEPDRMHTMVRARDTGQTSITPPVKSVRNVTNQPLLLMFVPQYESGAKFQTRQQRQSAIKGYIYSGFRAKEFFDQIISETPTHQDMVVRVSTNTLPSEAQLIYESPTYQATQTKPGQARITRTIDIYGQTWKLEYSFNVNSLVSNQKRAAPVWTIVAGFLVALLLAEVIFLLLKARARDLSALTNQAVDLAKDELLSLASHQLRTPATTVKQYLGMVIQGFAGDITATQQSLLDKAYAGNERQLYIINEMLHIAKIDAGRIVLAKQRTDIVKLVREIVGEAKNDIDEANHTLKLIVPKKPVYIRVDEHMLRMSVENIVSNAIKYTLPGGKITIAVKKDAKAVHISIQDTGVGIDQKDFSKLYKLFTRLDNKKLQNVSGTGVGLYLAKHLIGLHKGTLHLTSRPGEGSIFMITLPVPIKRIK